MNNRLVFSCCIQLGALCSRYTQDSRMGLTTRVYSTQPYPAFLQEAVSTAQTHEISYPLLSFMPKAL